MTVDTRWELAAAEVLAVISETLAPVLSATPRNLSHEEVAGLFVLAYDTQRFVEKAVGEIPAAGFDDWVTHLENDPNALLVATARRIRKRARTPA